VTLSTHVLDASLGRPAADVAVVLERRDADRWTELAAARTNVDGRIAELGEPTAGVHRIRFASGEYFAGRGVPTFYPEVSVVFEITDPDAHHHVPLLLSPYAYSTYRGS
jgi:5-hydroxyisourate hydrolase